MKKTLEQFTILRDPENGQTYFPMNYEEYVALKRAQVTTPEQAKTNITDDSDKRVAVLRKRLSFLPLAKFQRYLERFREIYQGNNPSTAYEQLNRDFGMKPEKIRQGEICDILGLPRKKWRASEATELSWEDKMKLYIRFTKEKTTKTILSRDFQITENRVRDIIAEVEGVRMELKRA